MSEMVERVGTAVEDTLAQWVPGSGQNIKDMVGRAVIAAMREPTQAMVGIGQVHDVYDTSKEINLCVWQAMIDEALK